MRPIIFAAIFLCSTCLLVAQSAQEKVPAKPATERAQAEPRDASRPLSEEETAALREDIARMRAILGQMETNLAFVDTTQSPLKHQFQLEIDMWNTVINDMERRIRPRAK